MSATPSNRIAKKDKESVHFSETSPNTQPTKNQIHSLKLSFRKEGPKEYQLINCQESNLDAYLESAFSKAVGLYKHNLASKPVTLDAFQDLSAKKYSSQEKDILALSEEWFDGLTVKNSDAKLDNSKLSALEAKYKEKIEVLKEVKEALLELESKIGKSESIQNVSEAGRPNAAQNSFASITAETSNLDSKEYQVVDKHFRPRKNRVLMKVDIPGILEVDRSNTVSSKPYKTLPPITLSSAIPKDQAKLDRFTKSVESSFVIEPRVVVFDDYIPYKTVSRTVTIRNKSRFVHRLRVSFNPPGSYPPRFSLNIQKTPTDHSGLISPGLSCTYNIEYTPNSFASTTEELLIVAENGESILLPIMVSREKPILNIPSVLNIGYCMEGRDLTIKFPIKNEGGEARFSAMLPNIPLGPFEIFEEIGLVKEMESKPLTISSFTISPSFIYLQQGDSVDMELCYAPPAINRKKGKKGSIFQRQDSQKFRYACDNCDIVEFQVVGTVQEAKVDVLNYFNPKENLAIGPTFFGDVENSNEFFVMDFGKENFGVPKSYVLTISNPTNLTIPFNWKWVRSDSESNIKFHHDTYVVSEHSNVFKISPSSGNLAPLSEMTFTITFLCFESKAYGTVLEMIVPSAQKRTRKTADSPKCIARIQIQGEGVPFDPQLNTPFIEFPLGLKTNSKYKQMVDFTNNSLSSMEYKWDIVDIDQNHCKVIMITPQGVAKPKASLQFGFEFIGLFPGKIDGYLRCQTANGRGPTLILPVRGMISIVSGQIGFKQDFIDLGLLKLGSLSSLNVSFRNGSENTIHYFISLFHKNSEADCFIKVKPSEGVLEPGKSQQFLITYVPLWYQQLRATLEVYAKSPSEKVDKNQLCLNSLVAAIDIKATTETPHVIIENPINHVTCFLGVPFIWTVRLRNTRLLEVSYYFKEQACDGCVVKFLKSKGTVSPMGFLDIKLQVECSTVGTKQMELVGRALEMVENSGKLTLTLNLEAYEPTFSFSVLENEMVWRDFDGLNFKLDSHSDAALRLDFGVCPIFAGRTRTLKIRNNSPYASPFNLTIEKYTPTLDNVDEANDSEDTSKQRVNTLDASSTHQITQTAIDPRFGFSSKGGQEYVDGLNKFRSVLEAMKAILSDGRGAAFRVTPSVGTIPPWSEIIIKISSYNNLVGVYVDWLFCSVGTVSRKLPVRLVVVGTPVKFSGPQLVSSKKNLQSTTAPIDIVNFGTRMISTTYGPTQGVRLLNYSDDLKRKTVPADVIGVSGMPRHSNITVRSPTKRILVENHSPREVKLHWSIYIKRNEYRINEEEIDINSYLSDENHIKDHEVGVIDIYPPIMTIPPFKNSVLHCCFRNCILGNIDAIVLADIAYVEGKQVKYGPRRIAKNGDTPSQEPVITPGMTSIAVKDQDAIAKLRILAKCIEPKLSLDVGSKIRIKKALNRIAELTADNSNLSSVQFLVNQSDAVCSFTLQARPTNLFSVNPSKSCLLDESASLYELKQKHQMMITVHYIGPTNFEVEASSLDQAQEFKSTAGDMAMESSNLTPSISIIEGENEADQEAQSQSALDISSERSSSSIRYISRPGIKLESGVLLIKYSNGMEQEIPMILEGVYE